MEVNHSIFPGAPLTFDEMASLIPESVRESGGRQAYFLAALLRKMETHLEDARMVSRMPVRESGYSARPDVGIPIRIRRVQEQMAAIRFRLDIHDYAGEAEKAILVARLYEAYDEAKRIDPDGVARFERMIDKKMQKRRKTQ